MNNIEPLPLMFAKPLEKSVQELKGDWLMQPKLDGIRLQAIIDDSRNVRMYTRTNHPAGEKLPLVAESLKDLSNTVLDGEAVWISPQGEVDFNVTARILGSGTDIALRKQTQLGWHITYVVFDVMVHRGIDQRTRPYEARQQLLADVIGYGRQREFILLLGMGEPPGQGLHQLNIQTYGEGSILKRLGSPYEGKRSGNWLKWKNVLEEDVVIMGFTPGKGKYARQIGAVEFGQYRDGVLTKRGRCSGMDDALRLQFTQNQDGFIYQVMTITHNGILATGHGFRHPQWSRFRFDKNPEDCTWT